MAKIMFMPKCYKDVLSGNRFQFCLCRHVDRHHNGKWVDYWDLEESIRVEHLYHCVIISFCLMSVLFLCYSVFFMWFAYWFCNLNWPCHLSLKKRKIISFLKITCILHKSCWFISVIHLFIYVVLQIKKNINNIFFQFWFYT